MKSSQSKYGIFAIIALCFLVFVTIRIVEAKKPAPEPEEPLELYDKNIITTTPIGEIMRVWGSLGLDSDYENIWNKEGERYKAVALGDIDGISGQRELCAASVNYIVQGRGKDREGGYRIVVDVYREGELGVILSSPEVWDRSCVSAELILANVDGNEGNEIILTTDRNLVIFQYDSASASIEIMTSVSNFQIDPDYWIESVAVADVDAENGNEILVTANPVGSGSENKGYLFIFKLVDGDGVWSLDPIFENLDNPYPYEMGHQSLAVGDSSDADTTLDKLCSMAYEISGDFYQNYLLVWDFGDWSNPTATPIGDLTEEYPWIHLDVGDVDDINQGDEIVLSRADLQPIPLDIYSLSLCSYMRSISTPDEVQINQVSIVDLDGDGDEEIICSGSSPPQSLEGKGKKPTSGSYYYIEVFSEDGTSEWQAIGGEPRSHEEVWDASIG